MLTLGSRGAAVADLQRRLAALGFNVGPVDGIFGPQTQQAVQSFQASSGVQPDGIVGPQTEALFERSGAPAGGNISPDAAPLNQPPAGTPGVSTARPITPILGSVRPEESPEFQAFLRSIGVERNALAQEVARRVGSLNQDLANLRSNTAFDTRTQLQGIANQFEGRGLLRSGETSVQQDIAAADIARQEEARRRAISGQIAEQQARRTQGLAGTNRQEAEERLATRRSLLRPRAENTSVNIPGVPNG